MGNYTIINWSKQGKYGVLGRRVREWPCRCWHTQEPGPQIRRPTLDEHRIPLAGDPFYAVSRPEREQDRQGRHCFDCLEEWVFLDGLDHDGEGDIDGIRCRRCGGAGKI
jgi:hypothetical protein